LQRRERAALHVSIEEPIKRRIPLDTRLGQHHKVGLFLPALLNRPDNRSRIALEIPVSGIDLADSNAHHDRSWHGFFINTIRV
jgi:hypothetical protein